MIRMGRMGTGGCTRTWLAWGVPAGPELVRSSCASWAWNPASPGRGGSPHRGDGQAHEIPDLVRRDFTAGAPGEKMVGDITYIPTWQGWLYLATVIDCHTKEVIGWATDDNYKTPLIEKAIEMAARQLLPRWERDFPLRPRQQLHFSAVR